MGVDIKVNLGRGVSSLTAKINIMMLDHIPLGGPTPQGEEQIIEEPPDRLDLQALNIVAHPKYQTKRRLSGLPLDSASCVEKVAISVEIAPVNEQ